MTDLFPLGFLSQAQPARFPKVESLKGCGLNINVEQVEYTLSLERNVAK